MIIKKKLNDTLSIISELNKKLLQIQIIKNTNDNDDIKKQLLNVLNFDYKRYNIRPIRSMIKKILPLMN